MLTLPHRLTARGRLVVLLLSWTLACHSESLLAPNESAGENLGRIAYFYDPPIIQVPISAPAGSDVVVTITTYGTPCRQQGRTDVVESAGRVDIYPIDIFPEPHGCPDSLELFLHQASFKSGARGVLIVTVHGTEVSYVAGNVQRRPRTETRMVTIR
jgi:hypothetical protein